MSVLSIGNGFWNVRASFKIHLGLVDIGTQMSVIQLPSGKYLIIDTVPLNSQIKTFLDGLTAGGAKIEAVLGTHPFHTLAFSEFYKEYPNADYYGTPRHIRKISDIPWAGSLQDCAVRNKWEPTIYTSIPEGAEFINPQPEKTNHFSSVFVFHPASRTLHVDDTIMYSSNPGFLVRLTGFKHGSMALHPTVKNVGLYPTKESPFQFRDWLQRIILDWDFDNICTAHLGSRIGGAKEQLQQTLDKASLTLFDKLSKKHEKSGSAVSPREDIYQHNVSGCECG